MGTPSPLGEVIADDLSSVAESARTFHMENFQINVKNDYDEYVKHKVKDLAFVDASFCKIFNMTWLAGSPDRVLQNIDEVVITRAIAEKYFGVTDNFQQVLGKIINLERVRDFQVVGVVENPEQNSTFPFRFLFSYEGQKGINPYYGPDYQWNNTTSRNNTYVLLEKEADSEQLHAGLEELRKKYRPGEEVLSYVGQPLDQIRFDTDYDSYVGTTNKKTLLALGLIGFFLLITASINFINLATAQASLRAREIGVRKAMGGYRSQIMTQFFTEVALITFFSLILSLAISEVFFLQIKDLVGARLSLDLLSQPEMLVFLLLVLVFVSVLSGFYPAVLLSKLSATQALKSNLRNSEISGGIKLRKGLVILQFAVTQFLIIGTFVINEQLQYFQEKDLGFERDAIISADLPFTNRDSISVVRLKELLMKSSAISDVTFGFSTPTGNFDTHSNFNYTPLQSKDDYEGNFKPIEPGYEKFFGIDLLAGRYVRHGDYDNVVINRKLAGLMGFGDRLNDAIGEKLKTGFGGEKTVVGVVEDFHTYDLSQEVPYSLFIYYPAAYYNISFKIKSSESVQTALKHAQKSWDEVYPASISEFEFLDEKLARSYESEMNYSKLIVIFSIIAVLLGCLGLYGLVAFVANSKLKEIGIRKVLGASVASILVLYSKEVLLLLILSFLLAAPVSYFYMTNWLNDYSYRIDLSVTIYLVAFATTMVIAMITISYRTIKSATLNPTVALKDE
jgi:ABC-type antimicrobial peptide transport system permease subunit